MPLCGKVEADVQIDIPAEKLHHIYNSGALHQASRNSCPAKIQGVQLLSGEWGKPGSIVCWNYTFDGVSNRICKCLVEDVDNNNMKLSTTFKVIEGDLLEAYKSFTIVLQAIPKDQGSVARWTMIYEKLNENIEAPTKLLDYSVDIIKELNAHMTQAQA